MSNRLNTSERLYNGDNNYTVQKSLIGHWPLNSTDGAIDLINGNNGTLNGEMSYGSSESRRYLIFDGIDDYVSGIPSIVGNTQMTVTIFAYFNALSDISIIIQGDNDSHEIFTDGTTLWAGIYEGLNDSFVSTTVTTEQWYHICLTWKSGSGAKLYINGLLIGTGPSRTGTLSAPNPWVGSLGARVSSGLYMTGRLSDVRLYDREITAAEVARLAQIIY